MGARWSVWRRWFLVTLVSSVGPGYELGYRWPLGLVLAGGMLVHVGSVRACTWLLSDVVDVGGASDGSDCRNLCS
jgi:hypothetical protein